MKTRTALTALYVLLIFLLNTIVPGPLGLVGCSTVKDIKNAKRTATFRVHGDSVYVILSLEHPDTTGSGNGWVVGADTYLFRRDSLICGSGVLRYGGLTYPYSIGCIEFMTLVEALTKFKGEPIPIPLPRGLIPGDSPGDSGTVIPAPETGSGTAPATGPN
jgi:hypothetical protein